MIKKDEETSVQSLTRLFEQNQKERDRIVLTLSSGALVLSLTFFEKMYKGLCPCLLISTWIFFALCLLSMLFSCCFSASLADVLILKEKTKDESYNTKIDILYMISKFLNKIAVLFFSLGIFTFLVFAIANFINQEGESCLITESILYKMD